MEITDEVNALEALLNEKGDEVIEKAGDVSAKEVPMLGNWLRRTEL